MLTIIYLKTRYFPPSSIACSNPFIQSLLLVLVHLSLGCHLYSFQPVHLSAELEGLLLSMCEDMLVRRTDLLTVLDACELHHKVSLLPPAERLIRQLVEDVYRNSVSAGLV